MQSTWEKAKKAADKILQNKSDWQIAQNVKYKINGKPAYEHYAQDAKQYYDQLKNLGYETLASNLESRNYKDAKKYMETFQTKMGRNQFRPYMYDKGKAFGLTSQDIDNLTRFDEETGEVFFGGKNLGKPEGIVDGVSYWDAEELDNAWNNYVKDSGITPPETELAKQAVYSSNKLLDKLGEDYSGNRDYIMKTGNEQRQRKDDFIKSQQNADIMNTDTAKSIMDKFNYLGGIAGGNEIASGAAANGGNIDSFSAANRARQQLAYTSAGTDAVIAEYQNRMNNVMDILKSIDSQNANEYGALNDNYNLGQGTAQQMSDNARLIYDNLNQNKLTDAEVDLTKANTGLVNAQTTQTDVQTEGLKSDITGTVTPKIADEQNPYLDENGQLKNVDFDYHARMKELEDKLAKTTDEAEKETIMLALSWLSRARDLKTGMPEYSQYAGEATPYAWETAGYKLEKANVKNARDIAMEGYKTDKDIATIETEAAKDMTQMEEEGATERAEISAAMQQKIQELKNADNQADRDKAEAMEKWIHENGFSEAGFQKWYIEKYGKDDYENTFDSDDEEEVEVVTNPGEANMMGFSDTEKKFLNLVLPDGEELSVDDFVSRAVNNAGTNEINEDSLSRVLGTVLGFDRASEIMALVKAVDPNDVTKGFTINAKEST